MKTKGTVSNHNVAKSTARVAGWGVASAAIGAAGGALYGLMFGGLANLVVNEPHGIVATAAYFALCGAISGALVGAVGAIILGHVELESEDASESDCKGRVFLRPCPRVNPLIARWRFLERTEVNGAHVQKNGADTRLNGADVEANGTAIEATPARVQGPGPARYQPRRSRAGADDELNNL